MKKIWLLLFAIVLGGCKMSDSANEASVEEETETKEFTLTVNNPTNDDYELEVLLTNGNDIKYSIPSGSTISETILYTDPLEGTLIFKIWDFPCSTSYMLDVVESMLKNNSITFNLPHF